MKAVFNMKRKVKYTGELQPSIMLNLFDTLIKTIQGPVSLRLMTSQFKDIVTHTQKKQDSKMHILRCMGSKFCVKFQRCPLKFHTKF